MINVILGSCSGYIRDKLVKIAVSHQLTSAPPSLVPVPRPEGTAAIDDTIIAAMVVIVDIVDVIVVIVVDAIESAS